MALFPELIMRIYTDNLQLIESAVPAFYVMLFIPILSIPANILFSSISGTGNTRSALAIELIALVIYVAAVIYIVGVLKSSVAVCWSTEYFYFLSMGCIAFWYMKRGTWKTKKI